MITHEQDATVSGLLKKRIETRRRRAAIKSELRNAGKSLCDIGGALKHISGSSTSSRVDYILPKLETVPMNCDFARMKAMLEELKELEIRLVRLNHSDSQMEID
jgi:hypothetical protein